MDVTKKNMKNSKRAEELLVKIRETREKLLELEANKVNPPVSKTSSSVKTVAKKSIPTGKTSSPKKVLTPADKAKLISRNPFYRANGFIERDYKKFVRQLDLSKNAISRLVEVDNAINIINSDKKIIKIIEELVLILNSLIEKNHQQKKKSSKTSSISKPITAKKALVTKKTFATKRNTEPKVVLEKRKTTAVFKV